MYEENLLLAVARLRANDKIPNLNIRLPGMRLSNGDMVYTCDNCDKPNNPDSYWITFHVIIPQSDLELTTQQIDYDSKMIVVPLDDPNPSNNRITYRFAYRIWTAYGNAIKEMQKTLKP